MLIDIVNMETLMTAREAAAELGVSPATLYAYVSRGMIRSVPQVGSRQKLYAADDVRALRGRAGAHAPAFGETAQVIETAMTAIQGGRLFYRGIDVETLAGGSRLETIASLLWQTDEDVFAQARDFPTVQAAPVQAGVVSRLLVDLAVAAEADPAAYVRTPDGVARTGARILSQMTVTLAGPRPRAEPIHAALARGWDRPAAENLIRTALVVLADHELAASTYAVRVATSTGATAWRAVSAGLACLDGPRHGGMGEQVSAFLEEIGDPGRTEAAFVRRLRAGQSVPGFGHPLYPDGDPRCRLLLEAVRRDMPSAEGAALAAAVARTGVTLLGRSPNVDFGLAVACRAADLPHEAPMALFAVARTVGWVGHVIEQGASSALIRPRARYVGRPPA